MSKFFLVLSGMSEIGKKILNNNDQFQENADFGHFRLFLACYGPGSWENAELAILTHGVVKSATLLIPPMEFNIENIGKYCFCSFFSKYVIFKFFHFLSNVALRVRWPG